MQTVNLVRGGIKLGPKQQEAIEALLRPGSIEDAAREIDITTKKLSGWMKNPVFMAAYRAAIRAEHRHCLACLAQGPTIIVKALLQMMYHGKKPAARLKAARQIILMAGEAIELEEYAAAVANAEALVKAAQARRPSAGNDGKAWTPGHGAKLPRRAEQAVAALLAHRSIAEAARAKGFKAATLRLWLEDPRVHRKIRRSGLRRFRTGDAACAAARGRRGIADKELLDRSRSTGRDAV